MGHKKCKGTGVAKGNGCGVELPYSINPRNNFRQYKAKLGLGLDCKCYYTWLYSSEEGAKIVSSLAETAKKKVAKDKKKEFNEKKRNLNVKGAMNLADTYFSRYMRLKYSRDGECTCFTCGTVYPIKEVDNGHYMKREHKATRYHENNCRPQCKSCNGDTKHNGKQAEFRVQLVNEIGEETVVKVEQLSRTIFKTNTKFFRDTADYYRVKLNELQKKLKIKIW